MRNLRWWLMRWSVFAASAGLWEIGARRADSMFFPPPSRIVGETYDVWFVGMFTGTFWQSAVWLDIVPSLSRAMTGWAAAILLGTTVGTAIGLSRRLGALFEPVVHYLRSMPPVAIVPIFIIILGIGGQMRVAVIAFGCTWPILLNTIYGVRAVDPVQMETASVYGVSRRRRLSGIVLPSASPSIFAGLRISLSVALILMVVSEMVAGSIGGIGERIVLAQRGFRVAEMWTGIIIVGVLGYALNRVFHATEGRILAWHRESMSGAA